MCGKKNFVKIINIKETFLLSKKSNFKTVQFL